MKIKRYQRFVAPRR